MPLSTTGKAARKDLGPLALTLGEPAGIGPEITFKAWQHRQSAGLPPFALIAPGDFVSRLRDRLSPDTPIQVIDDLSDVPEVFENALPVFEADLPRSIDMPEPGQPSPATANLVVNSIRAAVALARSGQACAVVTNPIAKSVLYEAGFSHPGHTEFLAELTAESNAPSPVPVMMLAIEGLRVLPLTIHVPLSAVHDLVTRAGIIETGRRILKALGTDFGIEKPRLAVAGLNPHAGENGAMGSEEMDIIAPAVAALRADGAAVRGPVPADTLFHDRARAQYDAVLCMYHDQALIPLKTLDFDRGVNITLGLPIVRTSPDHGTAFDIAGKGVASADSLISALHMAAEIAARRAARA